MKMNIVDLDADGDQDIVVSGKSGLYVFNNEGFAPRQPGPLRTNPETEYPSWVPWTGR